MRDKLKGMWVALKRCGCCVGVCTERDDASAKELYYNNTELIAWLRDGHTVRLATWEEWREQHMPGFLDCPHEQPETVGAVDPISGPAGADQ